MKLFYIINVIATDGYKENPVLTEDNEFSFSDEVRPMLFASYTDAEKYIKENYETLPGEFCEIEDFWYDSTNSVDDTPAGFDLMMLYDLEMEFSRLKKKVFHGSSFVVVDELDADQKRYDQLFQFFYPNYRTRSWVSPL